LLASTWLKSIWVAVGYFRDDERDLAEPPPARDACVAEWAERRRSRLASAPNILPLDDFNLPKPAPGDPILRRDDKPRPAPPAHATQIGSSIADPRRTTTRSPSFPGPPRIVTSEVYDYDGALFRTLFEDHGQKDFLAYCRYDITDHRPLWAEFCDLRLRDGRLPTRKLGLRAFRLTGPARCFLAADDAKPAPSTIG
jgi:hypothetical protein